MDLSSFVMGIALLAVTIGVLITDLAGNDVELRWVLPLVLLAVGLAGLVGPLLRMGDRPVQADTPDAEASALDQD